MPEDGLETRGRSLPALRQDPGLFVFLFFGFWFGGGRPRSPSCNQDPELRGGRLEFQVPLVYCFFSGGVGGIWKLGCC